MAKATCLEYKLNYDVSMTTKYNIWHALGGMPDKSPTTTNAHYGQHAGLLIHHQPHTFNL
ncbi:hypothetical protein PMIT1327_02426 [Prochlorococcus marinus str. MIT 1327]|nr:hypothetical protein PMIT1312_01373 [Prochlorococcus marinus str. MIT 1312]KZR79219.1 hypothetical protein PMIT1327_02426 [Prochlorococcus marinus str. MIT 1327]